MIITIARKGDNIITCKDYRDIEDKGEISHILMELEFLKQDLMELWDEWEDQE